MIKQTKGSIIKEFYLKKSIHIVPPPSLVWLMCLAAITKFQNIGRHFSEVQM